MNGLDKARQGTRNRSAGNNWNRACVTYLRRWWPGSERQLHAGRNDIAGIGDIAIEATIEPWQQLWKKMFQSQLDARARKIDLWCVWKKHNRMDDGEGLGPQDPGKGAVIFLAEVIFPVLAEYEILQSRWETLEETMPTVAAAVRVSRGEEPGI